MMRRIGERSEHEDGLDDTPKLAPGKRMRTAAIAAVRPVHRKVSSAPPTLAATESAAATHEVPSSSRVVADPFDFSFAQPADGVVGQDGGTAPAAVARAVAISSGSALPAPTRASLERSYGADLGDVRIHTGSGSAAAAESIAARAFTRGRDVHFNRGEYDPVSPAGFHLLAHEVAHTVQAGGATGAVQAKLEVTASSSLAEFEADRAADAAIRGDRFAITSAHAAASRAIHRVDQRTGTAIPTATQQAAIDNQLYPASAPVSSTSSAAPPWDGASGQSNEAANRTALIHEMHTAMSARLAERMNGPTGINAVAGQPRVPIADLEGAGQAAKADADAHFASWATAAALTTSQETARGSYAISASAPGQNLFDAQNATDRATAGMAINPVDLASWLAETVPACVTALNTHHLDKRRSANERDFLRDQIIVPWATANDAQLRLYDLHGFGISNPTTGQIVVPTSVPIGPSTTAPSTGGPSDAERTRRWSTWRTMVHEYIHQLEHPALRGWPGRNRTISEGFCELFTKEVLLPLLPTAGGADVTRRTRVEGGDHGAPGSQIMGGAYNPGSYAGYLARAETIRAQLGDASVGAQNAMKAIYFQGHVEFLGYDTAGSSLTAPAGSQDEITVPASITAFSTLATALNRTEGDLRTANPNAHEPLSGRLHAPGCREHRVVQATDGAGARSETARVIATQHGVTETALATANPGVNFTALAAGQIIIVPHH